MSNIVSIGTASPKYNINQMSIHAFMDKVYDGTIDEKRRLQLLYERSGISNRYSVLPDYDEALNDRKLYNNTQNLEPFPSIEKRMELYHDEAAPLAISAIHNALQKTNIAIAQITHLITVSCTGMSAPGLDLQLLEILDLPKSTNRSSVNFMGCYAAVHALKLADAIALSNPNAIILIVCVELCTLHFQKTKDYDNITANAIFADGAAACIVASKNYKSKGLTIKSFYSEVHSDGKKDMAWQLSSTGFLMTLSSYIPQLIEANIDTLFENALEKFGITHSEINVWAIHPGGRKILEAISTKMNLERQDLQHSYSVLNEFGNMSSPTILFVLDRILNDDAKQGNILGAAFGPGLTMETFLFEK